MKTKMSSRKGFTLVELLVTIVLLGIIAAIIIYNMMSISTNSKENEYERFIAKVKSAAATYADVNPEAFKDLYVNKAFLYIRMRDLIENGYIDENIVNPYLEQKVNPEEKIKANLNTDTGALTFTYPIDASEKNENFLSALSDYVIYKEPYDCMQGAGTYQLSLADENGDLIMLTQENIDKYHFTCEYPKDFKQYSTDAPASWRVGKYSDEAGTYQITYKWLTESNTPKEAKRTLRVLPKAKPSFIIKETTKTNDVYDTAGAHLYLYTFGTLANPKMATEYTPMLLDAATNKWRVLTYTPLIEGVDPTSTTFTVSKIAIDQSSAHATGINGTRKIVVANSSDYNTAYPVDDGIKQYDIECTIKGRYNKDYSYNASNTEIMHSKLIVPSEYITTTSDKWTTDKIVTVNKNMHSPVGIAYLEYSLQNRSSGDLNVMEQNTFNVTNTSYASRNTSLRNGNNLNNNVVRNFGLENDSCLDKRLEYPVVYVRAINDDGYIGDWTFGSVKLTSDMNKLIADDTNCVKSGDKCVYTEKLAYINVGTNSQRYKYVILEHQGDTYKTTLNGVGSNAQPISVKSGDISADSAAIHLTGNISYRTPVVDNIYAKTGDEWNKLINAGVTKEQLKKHMVYQKWSVSATKIVRNVSEGAYGSLVSYLTQSQTYSQSAYFGNATLADIQTYKNAMYENNTYWTTDNYVDQMQVVLTDSVGMHPTPVYYYTSDLYVATKGNSFKNIYASLTYPVKPMGMFKSIEACGSSVDASGATTYTIALSK